MNVYDVLAGWDLLRPDADLGRLSMKNWRAIAEACDAVYGAQPRAVLGAVHLGATAGSAIVEGRSPLSDLAIPLLTSERVWLPDPAFSLLSHRATEAWTIMPDSRSTYFGKSGCPHPQWESLWQVPIDRRKQVLRTSLPTVIARMQALKPLFDVGAVGFFPWELQVLQERENMREVALSISGRPEVVRVTQQLLQVQYNLGVRSGGLGLEASADCPAEGIKKGDPFYFANKAPSVVLGLLNAAISRDTGASFAPSAPGDRLVYDLLRSQTIAGAEQLPLAERIRLPRFAAAAWDEMVAIRQNADSLGMLRSTIAKAAGIGEEQAIPAIRDELESAIAKLRADSAVWRRVNDQAVDIGISTILPAVLGAAAEGPNFGFTVGVGTGGATFLLSLLRAVRAEDRKRAAAGAEILVRLNTKL